MNEPQPSAIGRARWLALARFAARDLRAGFAGLRIFVLCVALGVAAIVAVNSFSRSLADGLARDGRTILGGDASFSLMHRALSPAERNFLARRAALSTIVTLRAMARADSGAATLAEVKAVDDDWPRLGAAALEPATAPAAALARRGDLYGAAVEPALLAQLDLKIGDVFALGAARFDIRAALVSEPDRLATGLGLGPRALISRDALAAAGLIGPGSLARFTTRALLDDRGAPPSEAAVDAFVAAAKAAFPDAGWEARTRANVSPDFSRDADRFGEFLALVGLIALTAGGVGVANAAHGFVERKRATLAILKALGASGGEAVAMALIEFLVVAALGAAAGAAVGAATPFVAAALFAPAPPLPFAPALYPGEIALGALYGLLAAFAFAIAPLGRAHDAPVSQLFRSLVESGPTRPRRRYLVAAALGGTAIAAVAVAASHERAIAFTVVVGVALALAALRLLAAAAMALARRAPPAGPFVWRTAVANLSRPGAPTVAVVMSLGLGLAALTALTLVDVNLRDQLARAIPGRTPSFYFLDVRAAEAGAFRDFLARAAPQATIVAAPMLRGRIEKIGDAPAEGFKAKESAAWALEGDRGLTFADAPPAGSRLIAGRWWDAGYAGPPLVSMEASVADGLGLKIGDRVTLNVLGREVAATIANLRRVDWRSFAINFVFVFSPDAFKGAPYTMLFTAALPRPDDTAEAAVTRATAREFPSVAVVNVREALEAVEALTAKLALAIRAAAGVALLASALALAGALAAARRARLVDATILKILGATRVRLAAIFLAEYALLGAAAALFGVAAGTLAGYVIVTEIMGFDFVLAAGPAFAAAAGGLALTVGLGMIGAWRILGRRPAEFLREL
jgi:putative ABC transport system permease protein